MKLATSKPVVLLTVQPAGWPAQFEVMLLLKSKMPVIVSALRISRDRRVRLPPLLIVCLPLIQVTLSKIWKSFWLVMSGWLPFGAQVPDVLEVELRHRRGRPGSRLMPGMPTAAAGLVP